MRILVVNVNTSESMTAGIGEQARRVASPDTEIVALTPRFGAESVERNLESYLAAVAVMDRVLTCDQPYDAVIQAGYGEHGREGLQELLDVPVVDITEAAASTAMYLGHRYSVVTTLDRAVPLIEDRLLLEVSTGAAPRCARAGWPCSSWSPTLSGPSRRSSAKVMRRFVRIMPRWSAWDAAGWPSWRRRCGRAPGHRGARRGRGGRRRDRRGVLGAVGANDLEGAHVRAAAAEANDRMAAPLTATAP